MCLYVSICACICMRVCMCAYVHVCVFVCVPDVFLLCLLRCPTRQPIAPCMCLDNGKNQLFPTIFAYSSMYVLVCVHCAHMCACICGYVFVCVHMCVYVCLYV